MRVTLFGAAFDPPHFGHQQVAVSLIQAKLTDAVWLLPVKEHAFGKKMAPAEDRLAMTELLAEAIRDQCRDEESSLDFSTLIKVERFELDQDGVSYTYQTLKDLARVYPTHQFSFVIGSDNLARFTEWGDYQAMLSQFPFFVYPRVGYELQPLYAGMRVITEAEPVLVSSTEVREQWRMGESVEELIPSAICKYLSEHNLYRK